MFNIGWSELLLIGIVALVAIGPKELPGVLRMLGQWMGKARRMAAEFQGQFQEALREAELAETAKELKSLAEGTSGDLETGLKNIAQIEDKSEPATSPDAPAAGDEEQKPRREGDSPDDWPAASEDFVVTPAPKGMHPSWTEKAAAEPDAAGAPEPPETRASDAAPSDVEDHGAVPGPGEKAAG